MSTTSKLLPFQPLSMTTAELAAVSFLARYSGHTHELYAYQLRRWFAWCQTNGLDPLTGIQRAHVELYIRNLDEAGLMASSINTMMHGLRGYFRFAHIDGLIPADPAVYARLPKVHADETRTQGLDRLELIRFLQIAQTITVHHGALAYLLGINALRASEAAAVRIEDYADHCGATACSTWSARATSPRPCRYRPGPPRSGGLPRRTDHWTTHLATHVGQADRPTRRVPDDHAGREGCRNPSAHQPALVTPRSDHQRTRRGCPAP
ncbi:tyrosine-type recombinase/integrase [Nocardioides sp. NPDC051685]|uniref:tyrosine-type recombinase/integrase n=1 Tax=Nocardioides sp. NPDC051685 TaxID=3364334 RepID=UPI0037B9BDD1